MNMHIILSLMVSSCDRGDPMTRNGATDEMLCNMADATCYLYFT